MCPQSPLFKSLEEDVYTATACSTNTSCFKSNISVPETPKKFSNWVFRIWNMLCREHREFLKLYEGPSLHVMSNHMRVPQESC